MAADWPAIRVEFVGGAEPYKAIAKRHGLKEATVRQRAKREGWQAQRETASRAVTQKAEAMIGAGRVDELARFNEEDIRIAKELRVKVEILLGEVASANDVRALASAFEAAQRVGRLALGATTENTASTVTEVSSEAREVLHSKLLRRVA